MKSVCIAGVSITSRVKPVTSTIVAHSQRLEKNLSVNQPLPLRMLNIIVNCENIITAKVIVRAVSIECCKPMRYAAIVTPPIMRA